MTEVRPRPSQVTVATCLGVLGAALFLIGLYDTMAATRSVAMRDSLEDFLGSSSSVGMSVEDLLSVIRFGVLVAGVVAAVALVFAFYLRQRHQAARIGFTVAAILLVPGLLAPSGVALGSMLLALALIWLWSRPVRDWFAGRQTPPARAVEAPRPVETPSRVVEQEAQPVETSRPDAAGQPPAAAAPYAAPPISPYPPYSVPPLPQASAPVATSQKRPSSVIWAVVMTWVCSALVGGITFLALVVIATDRNAILDEVETEIDGNSALQELALNADQLVDIVLVFGVLVLVWCAAACVLAILTFMGMNWARVLLAISAAFSALLSLVSILAIVPAVTLAAAIAAIVLLFNARSNAWFRRDPAQGLDRGVSQMREASGGQRRQPW